MGGVNIEGRGQSRIPGPLYRVNWSLITSLGEMDKPWFPTNRRPRTKHTTACSLGPVTKECTEHPGYLVPCEGYMNWAINHWSPWTTWPSDGPTALWVWPFDQKLGVGCSKLTVQYPIHEGTMDSNGPPMTQTWRIEKLSHVVNHTLFSFFHFLFRYFCSLPWIRCCLICTQMCAGCNI